MVSQDTGAPAGGSLSEEAVEPGTGEVTPAGKNADRPGIGSMGGYAPNFPGESGGRDTTFIEPRTQEDGPVLDETDRQYLDLPEPDDT